VVKIVLTYFEENLFSGIAAVESSTLNFEEKIRQVMGKIGRRNTNVQLVFVFDEVRALLNNDRDQSRSAFACMRRAARYFPEKMGVAVVILDTVSRVSNLSPQSTLDPSYRPRTMDSCKLFKPLYVLPTVDHFVASVKEGKDKLADLLNPNILYKYGRPLWTALLSSNTKLFNISRV
jgi:hypothetical protein